MNKKGKIIYVCRRFNADKWGGTETVIINSARQLQTLGYTVKIFTTLALSELEQEFIEGIEVRRFPFSLPWLGLSQEEKDALLLKGGNLLSFSLFWALIMEKELALIHLHSTHRIGAVARTAAHLKNIPYVVSLHGGFLNIPIHQIEQMEKPFRSKPEWGRLFGWLFGSRRVIPEANAIISVGQDEYHRLKKKYPDKPIFYFPNGVNLEFFRLGKGDDFRTKYGFSSDDQLLLCVSRIDYQKNQLFLINALPHLTLKFPRVKLVLIGSVSVPDYYQSILTAIKDRRLEERVTVILGLGADDENLCNAYAACDVFVFPTLHEPFGIVILEAWAAQRPILTAATGGILGFTRDGEDCLHFNPRDLNDFVDKLSLLLNDSKLRKYLAENGHRKAKDLYGWRVITKDLDVLYEDLIRRNKKKSN